MKEIKITKLALRNFKGCAALDLDLEGKNAGIYGDNATGKTTVYDALTWLLFGKDSRGSADQELIKPLDKEGNVKDHEAVTCVEAELTVCGDDGAHCAPLQGEDGGAHCATLQLRKEMQESWVTRRGSSQAVYDGNEFRYAIDGVPLKKNEYARKVGELVEEDVFKMLTSVTAFAQDMPWKKRREILYDMSGVSELSDRALMQQMGNTVENPVDGETLEELSEMLSGKSLDDLRRVLAARRKALMGTRSQVPARLDELNRQAAPLQAQDYGAAEQEKAAVEQELEQIRTAIARIMAERGAHCAPLQSEAERKLAELMAEKKVQDAGLNEQRAGIRQKISELETELDKWSYERSRELDKTHMALQKLESDNSMFRWKQEKALPDLNGMRRKIDTLQNEARSLEGNIGVYEKIIQNKEASLDHARNDWLAVNAENFGGAKCPTCGQDLPMYQLQKARDSFEANKAKRLDDIKKIADDYKSAIQENKRYAMQDRERLENVNLALDQAAADLIEAEKAPSEVRDMDGYREQKEALEARQKELSGIQFMPGYREKHDALVAELAAVPAEWPEYLGKRAVIDAEIRKEQDAAGRKKLEAEQELAALGAMASDLKRKAEQADAVLRGREVLGQIQKRIAELREEQKRTAAELEHVDRLANGVEEFIRWKTRFIEDSVNGLFRIVSFRLFREQANGGLEERCDVVVDGVPYNALNNGTRINAGLDIIRRLAEHYGVRVPLFVDNAEGVTRLEDAGTQVIRLVVSERDKALRVETV